MPNRDECEAAIRTINRDMEYSDQAQFSSGRCDIHYSTDGRGPEPVRGATIEDTANTILRECQNLQGNYGTGNCDSCHVTISYRG
ncbi:hypothetical protein F5X96DRAFT_670881 [Biscogniauxia mediterranea]|nr:hypothetical protein F5X96DRAFT_670881 [Biscogniauxia mediterranea]